MGTRPRWGWIAAVVWVGVVGGVAVHAHFYPLVHTVYDVYRLAARHWWAGQDLFYARGTDYFRYSPVVAIGFTPFAVLPDAWGCPLWKIANAAVFAAGVGAWARRVMPAAQSSGGRAALFLLVLPGAVHSLYIGQANLLMVGAVLLGLAAAARDRWNGAAGWLALAALVKGYPLAAGLLLAALFPRRFAPRLVAALSLGLLLPFAAQRPAIVAAQYASWLRHLRASTVIMRERLRSLDHLFALYGHPIAPEAFTALAVVAGLVVLGLCLLAPWRGADQCARLAHLYVGFAAWAALFGPATESCTYVLMAPAVAGALVDAWCRRSPWPVRGGLVVSLLVMGPVVTDLFGRTVRDFANEHGSQPAGALLFLACMLGQAVLGSRTPAAPAATPPALRPAA